MILNKYINMRKNTLFLFCSCLLLWGCKKNIEDASPPPMNLNLISGTEGLPVAADT